ncbi:uroporphyrinogen-III C-methyltransferase [Vreelandella sedimenti]|uniref:uroporphyrinogen-III C-methyltransferase n=1 Tax=Vreelandella sedimenti TaxID=2729618 RepID=UPI00257CD3A2|nr:uroporphyrinogen-III C-methyltransferase [Halomonas sp. UBA3173]|tara:strand:+ start:65701 stop:67188 length:1488 start_codon:yes stop_codon:yes gene_type:complete
MSKQVNDQDDVQPTSSDASQGVPKTTDKAASTTDATEPSKPNTPPSSTTPAQSGAKNSRSRRRGKGSPTASSTAASSTAKPTDTTPSSAASPSQSAAQPSPSSSSGSASSSPSSSAASPKPTSNKSSAGTTPPTDHKGSGNGQSGGGKSGGSKSGGLAIALVIILAIALVFVAWQGWQRLESQQQRLDEVAQQAEGSASQQAVSDLESRLDSSEAERDEALQSTLGDLRDEFDSYRSDVDETLGQVLDQLSQEQDTDEREWLHAEAAYLLRLANQRLQLEGDVDGAAALLRTADARLVDADNPALTPVREAIANELAALDAVPQVDRTGLYLALNAQQERITSLRLSQEIEEQAVTSSIEQPPTGTFQRQLARFGEELKDLVVVRHHDEALEALITPEQESYLRQSLRLVLEQTQLALLNEEKELYDASIDKALQLLNDYYDTTREETQSVIARLQELKEAEVKPELPDISASQQELARFIDNRYETRGQSGGDS